MLCAAWPVSSRKQGMRLHTQRKQIKPSCTEPAMQISDTKAAADCLTPTWLKFGLGQPAAAHAAHDRFVTRTLHKTNAEQDHV